MEHNDYIAQTLVNEYRASLSFVKEENELLRKEIERLRKIINDLTRRNND